jgi:hypothetical protein
MFDVGRSEGCANGATKYIVVPGQRQVKEAEKKAIQTPKQLKVKRGGLKKKWNKRKFTRKTDETVGAEKDGGTMTGDAHDSDVPMQAIIPEERSTNATMAQPDEEVRRVEHEFLRDATMMKYNGEATNAKQEPPGGTAGLLHHDDGRRVELETSSDTTMTHHHNTEVRILKQEPSCDPTMLQPGEEARLVEPEPPRDMVQPNDTAILQSRNLVSTAEMLIPDKEARSTGQESLNFFVTLQPNGETTNVKEETPGNTAMMQIEDVTRNIEQVPPSNAEWVQPHEEPIAEHNDQNSEYACTDGDNKSTGDI